MQEKLEMWERLKKLPRSQWFAPCGYGEVILLSVPDISWADGPSNWLIGRYDDLTEIATALRNNEGLQNFIADHGVRFGLRNTDRPPVGDDRQERYGTVRVGKHAKKDHTTERLHEAPKTARAGKPVPTNRLSDRKQNVFDYWTTQTSQTHHIVEYNNLHEIGKSFPGKATMMDHGRLPCVLLAAEFHQRYISSALKFTHAMSEKNLKAGMGSIYKNLYTGQCAPLGPLWEVSKVILREAELTVA